MTRQEQTGTRDLTYSRWHRTLPDDITYVDVDSVEYCSCCGKILALVETAQDSGQSFKPTTVLRRQANGHIDKPLGFLVFYRRAGETINRVRMRQVAPTFGQWQIFTEEEWGDFLIRLHRDHVCDKELS